jgi:hypothetical protein
VLPVSHKSDEAIRNGRHLDGHDGGVGCEDSHRSSADPGQRRGPQRSEALDQLAQVPLSARPFRAENGAVVVR